MSVSSPHRLRHYPRCYGCGPANESGLALDVSWDGDEALLEHVPPVDAEGGPGVVHGGYLAALVDEVMALVAFEFCGGPAMTRRIELDLRAPSLVGRPLRIRARVAESGRRRVVVRLSGGPPDREGAAFVARGLFLRVDRDTWLRAMAATERTPDQVDWKDADPSVFFRLQMEGGLQHVFVPKRLDRPVRVELHLSDVDPPAWSIVATADGLEAFPGAAGAWQARFTGTFREWQQVLRGPASAAPGAGRVDGDRAALATLAAALDFRRQA